ncbi:ABC transporter permease [Massilia sp. TSP1-1-2]|uniref:ABC transporter permease n=1 Tax=Massilia sp. TSP1-1-2 TaxID=2804649 RepID=UPI003CFBA890
MHTYKHYLGLSLFLGGVFLRKLMQYRADFLIGAFGFVVSVSTRALFIYLVFRHVNTISGWSYHQVLFLFGFSLIPRGLDHMFSDQLWELGRKLIQRGEFFKYLIRPINPLFHLVSERFFYPDGLGEIGAGIAIAIYAAGSLPIAMSPTKALMMLLLVLSAALIYLSVKLAFASLAFWTVNSLPAMNAAYQLSSFVKYPLDIFHHAIQFALLWVLPFAFTAYVPVLYILHDDCTLVYWTPVVALLSFTAAYRLWLAGIERYDMTGS